MMKKKPEMLMSGSFLFTQDFVKKPFETIIQTVFYLTEIL